MSGASTSGSMSPQLLQVVERARREPEGRFHALAADRRFKAPFHVRQTGVMTTPWGIPVGGGFKRCAEPRAPLRVAPRAILVRTSRSRPVLRNELARIPGRCR
jgi:hypothetical protein